MACACKFIILADDVQSASGSLLPSLWSVFLITVSTVDGAALCGLEWNFAFLATVRAYDLMHLSWTTIELRSSSITHFLHSS